MGSNCEGSALAGALMCLPGVRKSCCWACTMSMKTIAPRRAWTGENVGRGLTGMDGSIEWQVHKKL